jgi:hypothetical protein
MRTDVKILLVTIAIGIAVVSCKRHHDNSATVIVSDDGKTTISAGTEAGKASVAAAAPSTTTVAIDSDKFKANIEIPGIEFDGSKMDIDGIKLPKGSAIKGMSVNATDKGGTERGNVVFDFASPMIPAAVADHLVGQIADSDWAPATRTTAADGAILLSTSKTDDGKETLDYRLVADGAAATRGTATIYGDKHGDKKNW